MAFMGLDKSVRPAPDESGPCQLAGNSEVACQLESNIRICENQAHPIPAPGVLVNSDPIWCSIRSTRSMICLFRAQRFTSAQHSRALSENVWLC